MPFPRVVHVTRVPRFIERSVNGAASEDKLHVVCAVQAHLVPADAEVQGARNSCEQNAVAPSPPLLQQEQRGASRGRRAHNTSERRGLLAVVPAHFSPHTSSAGTFRISSALPDARTPFAHASDPTDATDVKLRNRSGCCGGKKPPREGESANG